MILLMVQRIKNLRHPIHVEVNGNQCEMLSIGYLAHALGRSTWTAKEWTRIGLLPPAPVIQNPKTPNLRRRYYPAPFISAMKDIASKDYVVDRLDRQDWLAISCRGITCIREDHRPITSAVCCG